MAAQVVQDVLDQSENLAVPTDDPDRLLNPRGCGGKVSQAINANAATPNFFFEPSSDSVDDPDALKFVPNESAFRGPLQSGGTSPRLPRAKRGNGGLTGSGSANDGFFRRWVEDAPPDRPPVARQSKDPGEESLREEPANSFTPRSLASPPTPTSMTQEHPIYSALQNGGADQDGDDHFRGEASNINNRPTASRLASRRWAIIRSRLGPTHATSRGTGATSAVAPDVNISDELLGGGLAALMLKMHFDRDEQDRRRVPVLLHHLKLRVSDSVHPLKGIQAAFRIECEYVNGAARWVIYRELRDFVALHTHYRVAKVYRRGDFELPEFPLTSIPYFKFFKAHEPSSSHEERKMAFARLQRLHLENYLLALIKTVMFRPEANRLAKFFEISALSISLAKSGGIQGKAGVLRVMGNQASRRKVGRGLNIFGVGQATKPRWWIVRESFLVAVDDPSNTEVYEVFMFDQEFSVERPTRYYKTLQRRHEGATHDSEPRASDENTSREEQPHPNAGIDFAKPTFPKFISPQPTSGETNLPRWDTKQGTVTQSAPFRTENNRASTTSVTTIDQEANDLLSVNHHTTALASTQADIRRLKSLDVTQHTFHIRNSQRRLKLVARNERQLNQWITSIERIASRSHWTGINRFGSFAPIRLNVAAQWLVDGRDYFWNISRAISLAKHTIYIHDWWLSPELQLRRPGKNHYRVDNLLQRKAQEGVKIFVIVYREVSNRTTPTDSSYTKQRLVALHPNIMVQRSPGHYATGTFFWAHHEKLCVIDDSIAFMGGLDMCFGRWDTPQHALVDDPGTGEDQIWLGKDYANERIVEFHTLNKPFEDMYDRMKVPRMPWHDISLQILGQPARDLSRHFVQRWNFLLRIKTHSRIMPFLLPPAEFGGPDLRAQGLSGTCEVQICRSAGNWSMGFQSCTEQSIQNAYLKAIQMSEHFVYIENQFFITSTVVNEVRIENQIGDAIVGRIIRAHQEHTSWRACIIIPLLPGFTFPIDHSDASAVRLILECQNKTICRGPYSIFSRLRREGIEPNDYITFFGLRQWGKFRGGTLTTEQLYIHAKTMIVDDRLVIIGSANINERSQRGDRDSELACVIRDTDMIDSTMAGRPFRVGRFAHTLRVRLMREHLGVDVDRLYTKDLLSKNSADVAADISRQDSNVEPTEYQPSGHTRPRDGPFRVAERIGPEVRRTRDSREVGQLPQGLDTAQNTIDSKANEETFDTGRPTAKDEGDNKLDETARNEPKVAYVPSKPMENTLGNEADGLHSHPYSPSMGADGDENGSSSTRNIVRQLSSTNTSSKPWVPLTPRPNIDPDMFDDPVSNHFYNDVWLTAAIYNTEIFRKVFYCTPDDNVTTWKHYKEFAQHQERLAKSPNGANKTSPSESAGRVPSDIVNNTSKEGATLAQRAGDLDRQPTAEVRSAPISPNALHASSATPTQLMNKTTASSQDYPTSTYYEDCAESLARDASINGVKNRKTLHLGEPFEQWELDEMEQMLRGLCGHLVIYPTRFLEGEDISNNFLFNADRLLPLPIYD